ncbi:hypothetical protein I862_02705 [endosymbiont of Acanthamoeba sp. UWC8]|nr:hypothetical protein I862_02705 [endosymbiont of Acanthamoeba sp. UWC8]
MLQAKIFLTFIAFSMKVFLKFLELFKVYTLFIKFLIFITPILASLAALSCSAVFIIYLLSFSYSLVRIDEIFSSFKRNKLLVLSLLAFLSFCFLSALYSLNYKSTLLESLKVSATILCGFMLLFASHSKLPNTKLFLSGYLVALVFCYMESIFNGMIITNINHYLLNKTIYFDPSYLNRGMTFIAIAVWVAIIPLIQNNRKISSYCLLLLSFVIIFIYTSESAKLGIIGGIVTYILAKIFKHNFVAIFQVGIGGVYIFIPIAICCLIYNPRAQTLFQHIPWSFEHRIYIWQNVLDLISLRPLTGYGFNAARIISELNLSSMMIGSTSISLLPLHPHNGVIQILLELGLIGLVLNLTVWLSIIRSIALTSSIGENFKPFIYALLATYITISQSSFNIFMSWWLCLIFIIVFNFLILSKVEDNKE